MHFTPHSGEGDKMHLRGGVKDCGVFEKYSRKNYSPQNILLPQLVKF